MILSNPKKSTIAVSLSLSLIVTFVPILRFSRQIAARRLFNDDCAQHTWIFHKVSDPTLFPGDPIYQYMHDVVSLPAFRAFYDVFAVLGVHPLDAGNLVGFVMVAAFVLSAWWIGYRIFGVWWAVLLVALVVSTDAPLRQMSGGHARAFGWALIFLSFASTLGPSPRREWLVVVPPLGLALFYPVGLFVTFSFFCLRLLTRFWKMGVSFRGTSSFKVLTACLCVHLFLFGVILLQVRANPYGPIITAEQAAADPHWTGIKPRTHPEWDHTFLDVKYLMFRSIPKPLIVVARQTYHAVGIVALAVTVGVLLCILALLFWFFILRESLRWQRFGQNALDLWTRYPEFFLLVFAGIGLYVAARIFWFRMYFPTRYLNYTIPFLMNFFLVAGIWCCRDLFGERKAYQKIGGAFLISLVSFLFVFGLFRSPRDFGFTVPVTPEEEKTLEFIDSLPKDSLIFTSSSFGDLIPLLGRRSILWSYETHHPFHQSFAEAMDQRVRAGVKFLTEGDTSGLQRFKTTHVVLERDQMGLGEPFDPSFLVSPVYDEYVSKQLTYSYPQTKVVYQNDDWVVMDVR